MQRTCNGDTRGDADMSYEAATLLLTAGAQYAVKRFSYSGLVSAMAEVRFS